MVAVFIHIGDARFAGSTGNTHMVHVARGTSKTVTDIPDRIVAREMTKKDAYKMCPAVKTFMMFVAFVFGYKFFKNIPVYHGEKLTENDYIYHCTGGLFVFSI